MRFVSTSLRRAASLALCLAVLGGCDSGGEPDDSDDLVNGITKREIRSGYIPSYPEIDAAFDVILADDPTLPDDEMRFARALFDEVNRAGDAADGAKRDDPQRQCEFILNRFQDLTCEEWIVVLGDPELALLAREASFRARNEAERAFPCGATLEPEFNDDKADAYRHAAWNAYSIYYISRVKPLEIAVAFTTRLTTAHENSPLQDDDAPRRLMDLSNNAAGRLVVLNNPDASLNELSTLLLALPFEYVDPDGTVPQDPSRLVYFLGRTDYDVTMTGSFSNPDSGGPWDATLTLNQCNDTIRGGLEITRGDDERQQRGVVGVVDGNTLDLHIGFPIGGGFSACRDMEAQLSGSPTSLSGPWTSSNCPQGGQFSLTASP